MDQVDVVVVAEAQRAQVRADLRRGELALLGLGQPLLAQLGAQRRDRPVEVGHLARLALREPLAEVVDLLVREVRHDGRLLGAVLRHQDRVVGDADAAPRADEQLLALVVELDRTALAHTLTVSGGSMG